MSAAVCKLSVVCPAYEEEEVLPRFHAELCAALLPLAGAYEVEILYVDDGSRDRTLEVLRRLAAGDARVRYLSLSRNFGQQTALTAGLEHARGDVVITLDADLQHPPELIPVLLERWRAGHDVVLTLRQQDQHLSPLKRLTSRSFYRVMRWLSDIEVRAEASDYRLLSRKAVEGLLRLPETHRFLRGMVSWLGFPSTTVVFDVASRGAGRSKYTLWRLLNLAGDGMLSFSKLPLRLPLLLGALVVLLGLGYGAGVLLAAALSAGAPGPGGAVGGWLGHALLVVLLLLGGSILCAVGVVGEYVGRVYEQVKGRPLYLLKESSPLPGAHAGVNGVAARAAEAAAARPGRPRPAGGASAA
jgi:dolichol-phosphate mannosyltransferase